MHEDIFESIRLAAGKRNLRKSTIQLYCQDVGCFLRYTAKPVSTLTIDDVDGFLTWKRLEGRSPETYNHYHSAIRFFYKKILKMNWNTEICTICTSPGCKIFVFSKPTSFFDGTKVLYTPSVFGSR